MYWAGQAGTEESFVHAFFFLQMPRKKRLRKNERPEAKIYGIRYSNGVARGAHVLEGDARREWLGQSLDGDEPEVSHGSVADDYIVDDSFDHSHASCSPEDQLRGIVIDTLKSVWVSPDGRECHFVQQACDTRTGAPLDQQYSFVGIRIVQYEGEKCVVSWCSNADCSRCHSFATCFQMTDFPDLKSDAHLADLPRSCPASQIAVEVASIGLLNALDLEGKFQADLTSEVTICSHNTSTFMQTLESPGTLFFECCGTLNNHSPLQQNLNSSMSRGKERGTIGFFSVLQSCILFASCRLANTVLALQEIEGEVIAEHKIYGHHLFLVRAKQDFHAWGAVTVKDNGKVSCRSCSGRHCKHKNLVASRIHAGKS